MNIFATSPCPSECAKYLDDKRVVKMCLETAQMLSTAINENGGKATYKSTHKNHPSCVWVRTSKANYNWTISHFICLLDEYTKRYNKTHKCSLLLKEFKNNIDLIPDGCLSPIPNCAANVSVGVSYKHVKNVYDAYKEYLCVRWETDKRTPTWYGV